MLSKLCRSYRTAGAINPTTKSFTIHLGSFVTRRTRPQTKKKRNRRSSVFLIFPNEGNKANKCEAHHVKQTGLKSILIIIFSVRLLLSDSGQLMSST